MCQFAFAIREVDVLNPSVRVENLDVDLMLDLKRRALRSWEWICAWIAVGVGNRGL